MHFHNTTTNAWALQLLQCSPKLFRGFSQIRSLQWRLQFELVWPAVFVDVILWRFRGVTVAVTPGTAAKFWPGDVHPFDVHQPGFHVDVFSITKKNNNNKMYYCRNNSVSYEFVLVIRNILYTDNYNFIFGYLYKVIQSFYH